MTSSLKTRARVSFIADLSLINEARINNGHKPWTEKDFFALLSGRAVITLITDDNVSDTLQVKQLGYIVI